MLTLTNNKEEMTIKDYSSACTLLKMYLEEKRIQPLDPILYVFLSNHYRQNLAGKKYFI